MIFHCMQPDKLLSVFVKKGGVEDYGIGVIQSNLTLIFAYLGTPTSYFVLNIIWSWLSFEQNKKRHHSNFFQQTHTHTHTHTHKQTKTRSTAQTILLIHATRFNIQSFLMKDPRLVADTSSISLCLQCVHAHLRIILKMRFLQHIKIGNDC